MNVGPQTLRSVVQYLKGIDMPATKEEIIQTATTNHAPQDVIDILQQLPDQTYQEMDDIWSAVGKKL